MQNSTLPSDDVMAITDVVHDYQTHLKCIYNNLPEVSTQSWFDNSVQKQFINITLVKSLENDTHYVEEYYSSTQQMIKDEVVLQYHTQLHRTIHNFIFNHLLRVRIILFYYNPCTPHEEYVDCNKIFQIDCSAFQLLLIEGNASTGKLPLLIVCVKNGLKDKRCASAILVLLYIFSAAERHKTRRCYFT